MCVGGKFPWMEIQVSFLGIFVSSCVLKHSDSSSLLEGAESIFVSTQVATTPLNQPLFDALLNQQVLRESTTHLTNKMWHFGHNAMDVVPITDEGYPRRCCDTSASWDLC